ncbi:hypothetical protein BBAD15_g5993 [Beauveria bassiana D1-5]|uniref:Stc1 domain-containing protein n=1 Tax=Beauveria bassiana D1-5 TaxID=1245745 RepID=A0A0A2VLE2_BEABA|nr:hypothetical protein BBAD15_g5993 [Beauveria bassiana D1-5]
MNAQTSSSRAALTAPTRFRCKVGDEWKDLSEFSNAQQKNLQYLSAGDWRLDPAHCGMTCKQHSAGSRSEMRCDVCMLVKPIDEFSKNSRRNGEYQCRRCVAWTEIQEPALTPGPLETGHISPEEEQQQALRQRFLLSQDFFPDDDDDDDDDDLIPQTNKAVMKNQAPITAFASLGLSEESCLRAVGSAKSAAIDEFLSRADDASSTLSVVLPPHLRSKYKAVSEAASSASSTAGDMSLPTTLLESDSDTASIVSRSFNAWGPDGGLQRRFADSVASSSVAGSSHAATSVTEEDANVVGDWSRVRAPKTAGLPKRKGGWPKTSEENRLSVAELRQANGDVHQGYVRRDIDTQKRVRPLGYDSDDSD